MSLIDPRLLVLVALGLGASTSPGADEPQSHADAIAGCRTQQGLLTFHRKPGTLLLELPDGMLDAPLGFAAVQVTGAGDFSVRGTGLDTQLVSWRRVGDRLALVKENLDFRADPDDPIAGAVQATFSDSPVFSAEQIPLSDDDPPLLIDASGLFAPGLAEILPDDAAFAAADPVLEELDVFDDNVVARVRYRLERQPGDPPPDTPGWIPWSRWQTPKRIPDHRVAEMIVDYHVFRLPDDGYQPRAADERIGGMTTSYKDFTGADDRDTLFRHLLLRFDVRKADPDAALSPPVEPITFVMDHSVPERWRGLVREGTLWWNAAFEAVGIRDAIRVLDPPDDPDWDPASLDHSVIYWNLSDDLVFSGLAGPFHVDPRTGQTLKANVYLNGEFFSFALNRYLVYAWWRAPEVGHAAEWIEARRALMAARSAQSFCDRGASFSSQIAFARLVLQSRGLLQPGTAEADRYAREAFLELVSHEVGHALGFPHNWKASLIASWEDVRDGKVTGRLDDNIFSASVMDYDPINLAPRGQPQGDFFMQELGPFDYLFVEYIYKPMHAATPAERSAELDRIAARAEIEPGLLYDGGMLNAIDPTDNSDDLGDDPLAFADSRLTILREEVLPRLPELVLAEGHDYSLIRQALDAAVFSVAMDYVDMVARHVGGQILLKRVANSPASPAGGPPPIEPVSPQTQRRALAMLDEHLFDDGALPISPELLAQLKADMLPDWNYPWRYASDYDVGARIAGLYDVALGLLLEPARLARILDNERRTAGDDRFTIPELLVRLRESAFDGSVPGADRRALQRLLVQHLVTLATEPGPGTPAEASQVAALVLEQIAEQLGDRGARADPDLYLRAHHADLQRSIRRALSTDGDDR